MSSFGGSRGNQRQQISELELEQLIDHHTDSLSPAVVRSPNRNSQLISRSSARRATGDTCEDRGGRIARVAYAKTKQALPRNRRSLSYAVASLVGMIIVSLLVNGYEGTYMSDAMESAEDKDSFSEPVVTTDEGVSKVPPHPASSLVTPISQPPTLSPTARVPEISIHDHKKFVANNTALHAFNSFSSWLDFTEADPPPATKFPKLGQPNDFVSQWCNMDRTVWFPEEQDWRRRAPLFLLPGAAFSGTVYLASALHTHPSVTPARSIELRFFLDRQFRNYIDPKTEKTQVFAARERMYANQFPDQASLQQDSSLVSFDATPSYLFYSTLTPRRILCVEPWVKLVFLLRNPVDRVLEHYAYMQDKYNLKISLDDMIDEDMDIMSRIGLFNVTPDTAEEDNVWYDYQSTSKSGLLGRSLYVIQVRHWVQALRMVGRNPATEILLVRTDVLAADPAASYNRILDFLGLSPQPLTLDPPKSITHQTRAVSTATRQRLEDLFRPYNTRLKGLMRKYGLVSG